MGSIGDRVKQARLARGMSLEELADKVGIRYQSVQDLENGSSRNTKHLLAYARALRIRHEWLEREEGDMEINEPLAMIEPGIVEMHGAAYAAIGRFDARLSAGPGSLVADHTEPLGYYLIEQQWLRMLTMAGPQNLAVVRVDGDSMFPTLSDGDWVLIDRTQCSISREGIYALRVGDYCWVKRLSLNLRDQLVRIISDNSAVPMQEESEENLQLLGRVVSIVARRVP